MAKLKLVIINLFIIFTVIAGNVNGGRSVTTANNHIIDGTFNESQSSMSGSNYINADGQNVPINNSK